ncbi:MAG: two-component system response regulator [Firmicutes bacterium]|nr:two-component system response regulator [Bacillota bacterium]
MVHTVLIVDDKAENIDILKSILGEEYNIKVAINGQMCIKAAEKTMPDIILLDIMMPDMNGYEVCTRLKANPITHNIPVIFVTTKDHELDEAKGFEVGAVDYVTKPVSPLIVKARIRTQLALKDQNAELERKVACQTKEIYETRLEIIKRLGLAAEFKDFQTGLHIERMSKYVYYIAKAYGLNETHANLLLNIAPLHDIGKIGIPEHILLKPGKLTDDEFEIIKTHCEMGAQIIGNHDEDLLKAAKIVAIQHHEKWNGTGYPYGLSKDNIHIYARIAAVADVFDALSNERPYKHAWSNEKVIEYLMNESGNHFDPMVVNAFIKCIDNIYEVKEKFSYWKRDTQESLSRTLCKVQNDAK